ncbi:MAG: hypothetical protein ACLFUS_05500 [Candidatus Sumerlaeia bacterium]
MPWSLFPTTRPSFSKTSLDLLFLLGLLILFYGDPFLNPSTTSFGGDGLSLFLPASTHYIRSMHLGIIPLWNSYTWMGAPFLAAYQAGVLYPPNLIMLFFQSADVSVNFCIFLSLLWLAYGGYFFGVRALHLERAPALLMAIIMSCSGFVGGHMDHFNQLAAISWIPWVVSEALILLRYSRVRNIFLLAICLAFQVLAGHPQYVVYTLVYLAALALVYFVYYQHRRRQDSPPSWLGILLLGIAIFLGIGLTAAQLLPSQELARQSVRQLDSEDYKFGFSLPPRNLLTLVYPHAYGNPVVGLHDIDGSPLSDESLGMFKSDRWPREQNIHSESGAYAYDEWVIYMGLFSLFFAVFALISLWREFAVRCFFFLALLVLLFAFGSYVPIKKPPYGLLMDWVPGGDHMRVPARFMIFFILSLAVLAGIGFNQLFFVLRERKRIPRTTLAPLRVLILAILFFDLFLFSEWQAFRFQGSTSILTERTSTLDYLAAQSGDSRVFRQMQEVPHNIGSRNLLRSLSVREAAARLQVQRVQPNLNVLHRIPIVYGYFEGLLPTMSWFNFTEKYRRNLYSPEPDTWVLGLMNVKYMLSDRYYEPTPHLAPLYAENSNAYNYFFPDYPQMQDFRRYVLFGNRNFVPKFVLEDLLEPYVRFRKMDVDAYKPDSTIAWGQARKPVYDYRQGPQSWVENKDWDKNFSQMVGGFPALHYVRDNGSPNTYILQKPRDLDKRVLMLEASYPGWVCTSEKGRVPLKRVNAVMMGCRLPSDVSFVKFKYEPFSFRLGLFISCLFVMLLGMQVFFLQFPRNLVRRQPIQSLYEYMKTKSNE